MKKTPLGYFLMKERYFLEQIIVPNAVFVVTTADPPKKLSWPTRRGGTALHNQTPGLQAMSQPASADVSGRTHEINQSTSSRFIM
jgi:hypothetical protein